MLYPEKLFALSFREHASARENYKIPFILKIRYFVDYNTFISRTATGGSTSRLFFFLAVDFPFLNPELGIWAGTRIPEAPRLDKENFIPLSIRTYIFITITV